LVENFRFSSFSQSRLKLSQEGSPETHGMTAGLTNLPVGENIAWSYKHLSDGQTDKQTAPPMP